MNILPMRAREVLAPYWQSREEGQPQPTAELLAAWTRLYGVAWPPTSSDHLLLVYLSDPALFFASVLGVVPWVAPDGRDQLAVLEALRRSDRVAVRSGHKTGKSNLAAGYALYFTATRPGSRVALTSATYLQVRRILWYEVQALYRHAAEHTLALGGVLYDDPTSGLQYGDGREVFGFSTREPERASGISGPNNLFVIDEASGITQESVFEALEGNRAGGAKMLLASNPTRNSGYFHAAFHEKRHFWETIHLDSRNTPNARSRRNVVPGLATRDWVDEKAEEWGEASPLFRVRVAGEFPQAAENAVFPLDLISESAERRERHEELFEAPKPLPLTLGIDVARFGDDPSVLQPVVGLSALTPVVLSGADGPTVARHALDTIERLYKRRRAVRPTLIMVDAIGVGAAVVDALHAQVDRLRELHAQVVPVSVSERAQVPMRYANLRAEITFHLRRWIEEGGMIPSEPRLEAELAACVYEIDAKGRYSLPRKELEKRVLRRSPNFRDALALAAWRGSAYDIAYASAVPREGYVAERYVAGY